MSHQKWAKHEQAKRAPVGSSAAEKALKKLNEADNTRFTYLFTAAEATAKHTRPFVDYEWQVELDKGL